MRRLLPLLLALLTAAALVAGCGSSTSSSSSADDPARAVPASSLVYAAVQVRPEGDAKSGIEAAGRKILAGKELGPELQRLIDKGLKSKNLSYGSDIAPWLGRRAAFAVTGYGASMPDVVLAVNSTDDAKAADFLKKVSKNDRKESYKGVDYYASSSSAVGVTDGYLLVGSTPAAFKTAVDTVKGGSSLADSSTYKDAASKVTTDGLGLFFVDAKRLIDVLGQTSQGAQALSQLKSLTQFRDLKPTAVAMTADGDAIRFEAPTPPNTDESTADAVAKLPANSWLAFALPKAGEKIRARVNSLSGTQRQQFEQVKRLFREQTGLDLDADILRWIKGVSIFATGTTLPDLKAGIVLDSSDPAASRRALDKIAALLARRQGVPLRRTADGFEIATPQGPVTFTVTGDRVLIAFGKDAKAALDGSDKLEGSDTYKEAQKALGGGRPAFLVSVPTIVQFAQNLGARNNSGYLMAEPYLKAFGALTSGIVETGGKKISRLAIGLR